MLSLFLLVFLFLPEISWKSFFQTFKKKCCPYLLQLSTVVFLYNPSCSPNQISLPFLCFHWSKLLGLFKSGKLREGNLFRSLCWVQKEFSILCWIKVINNTRDVGILFNLLCTACLQVILLFYNISLSILCIVTVYISLTIVDDFHLLWVTYLEFCVWLHLLQLDLCFWYCLFISLIVLLRDILWWYLF